MTIRIPNLSHLIPSADAPRERASNEEFAAAGAPLTSPAARGWDPFEVWRKRVFQAAPKSYNKDRGNT